MQLPIAFFETRNIGDLMQSIQDNTRVQNFLSSSSVNILFSAFSIIVFGVVLFIYSSAIFFIFLLSAVTNFIWVGAFMKRRATLDCRRFDQAAENQSSTMQLLNGMQEIKLNISEKRRRWKWKFTKKPRFGIAKWGNRIDILKWFL